MGEADPHRGPSPRKAEKLMMKKGYQPYFAERTPREKVSLRIFLKRTQKSV
jgi:hypothetical protein